MNNHIRYPLKVNLGENSTSGRLTLIKAISKTFQGFWLSEIGGTRVVVWLLGDTLLERGEWMNFSKSLTAGHTDLFEIRLV